MTEEECARGLEHKQEPKLSQYQNSDAGVDTGPQNSCYDLEMFFKSTNKWYLKS